MKCEVCGKTPADGKTTLLRQNRKGETGVWRCTEHNKKPVDENVQAIIDAINSK